MDHVIGQGRFATLLSREGWEFVRRTNTSGIVIIIALTPDERVLFVEQFRPPVAAQVIELPAGLAGDIPGQEDEDLSVAAQRELEEETGYRARFMQPITSGPVSAGLSDELITLFLGTELERVGPGGGDESESITIHEVPLSEVDAWLEAKRDEGILVDPKVYSGLYFLQNSR
jgi:ADP-ribose pyrophosphatase